MSTRTSQRVNRRSQDLDEQASEKADRRTASPFDEASIQKCILGERQVCQMTNLSRTTRWRMERQGEFPKRVRLSPGRVGWREQEVVAWIDSRS